MRWSVMVLPKPRSAIFRLQYRNFRAPFLTASLVSSPSAWAQPARSVRSVLERSELSTWEGAVPLGPGDGAEPLAYFAELCRQTQSLVPVRWCWHNADCTAQHPLMEHPIAQPCTATRILLGAPSVLNTMHIPHRLQQESPCSGVSTGHCPLLLLLITAS